MALTELVSQVPLFPQLIQVEFCTLAIQSPDLHSTQSDVFSPWGKQGWEVEGDTAEIENLEEKHVGSSQAVSLSLLHIFPEAS